MEEKEKEILDPRKVFSLFFFFFGKVEWSQESMGGFYFNGILDNWVIG